MVLPHMVHIPEEWAVRALERPCTPYEMFCWVAERVADLPPRDWPVFHTVEDWCLACCARRTALGHQETSALAVELPLVGDVTEVIMEEAEHQLWVTLRLPRKRPRARVGPVEKESLPAASLDTGALGISALEQLSLITRAFMEGTTAHKRLVETVVALAARKYTELQMARLQGWYGLGPEEREKLLPIWGKLQAARDKEETRAVLSKNFERLSSTLEEPLNIYFSDRLVVGISKLRLSPNRDPDYASAHLGISVLAVLPMSAAAQVQLDEEAMET